MNSNQKWVTHFQREDVSLFQATFRARSSSSAVVSLSVVDIVKLFEFLLYVLSGYSRLVISSYVVCSIKKESLGGKGGEAVFKALTNICGRRF